METFTTNAPALASRLASLAERVGDPQPALERARTALAAGEREVWSSQGAAIGDHWSSAAEPDRKADAMMLVATGRLRASLAGPDAGEVAGETLKFGTDVPYARFHQFGTSRMPARPFLGVPPDVQHRLTDELAQLARP